MRRSFYVSRYRRRHVVFNHCTVHCVSIGCLNAQAQTGKVVFKDPDPSRPDATLWRLTHDPAVRDYANYHNTQCWSPDGRYISINRWADRTKKSGAEIRLYDLHKDEDTLIGLGIYPRWANRHNWLFYSQYTGKGESYEEGIANQWLDVDTGKTVTIGHGIEFLGETDSQDRWLYGNQRFRGQTARTHRRAHGHQGKLKAGSLRQRHRESALSPAETILSS